MLMITEPKEMSFKTTSRCSKRADSILTERLTAALEEIALAGVGGAADRRLVCSCRLGVAAEAAQQIGADGVVQMRAIEAKLIDKRKRRTRPCDLGHSDRAVERHDWTRSER